MRRKDFQDLLGLTPFRIATDKSSNNIVIVKEGGTILYMNDAVLKSTGHTEDELIKRNVNSVGLWGGYMSKSFQEGIWKTINAGKTFVGEVVNKRKNGAKFINELSIFPIVGAENHPILFVSVARDITKEREIDRTKTDFIALASHQLRTPLANMSLALDLVLTDSKNEIREDHKKKLEQVYKSVHDMAGLIGALLDVSKIQLGTFVIEPRPTDIKVTISMVLDKLKLRAGAKGLRIVEKIKDDLPIVQSDRNIVQMVLQNVLSNAIKYTPDKGLIVVKAHRDKERIIISVQDTGWGIPKKEQDQIFSKFFRANNVTRKEAQGVGMGLYLAKMLLQAIKGNIYFESKENIGTTFYISIPINNHSH